MELNFLIDNLSDFPLQHDAMLIQHLPLIFLCAVALLFS